MHEVEITVVMANFRQSHFIEDAIKSVVSQSLKNNVEILIIDDCSSDNSIEVIHQLIKKYNIENRTRVLVNEKNMGYGFTLDRGIREAKGNLVAIVDSDDALASDKALEIERDIHIKRPDAALVYSNYIICNSSLKPISVYKTRALKDGESYLVAQIRINHFKMLKKNYYKMTAGINLELKQTVDKELNLRLEEVGRLVHVDVELMYYRRHKNSLTRSFGKKSSKYRDLIKKMRKQIYIDAKNRRKVEE
jgi:glycosyltransferase involved in cell wall biosynthesis